MQRAAGTWRAGILGEFLLIPVWDDPIGSVPSQAKGRNCWKSRRGEVSVGIRFFLGFCSGKPAKVVLGFLFLGIWEDLGFCRRKAVKLCQEDARIHVPGNFGDFYDFAGPNLALCWEKGFIFLGIWGCLEFCRSKAENLCWENDRILVPGNLGFFGLVGSSGKIP